MNFSSQKEFVIGHPSSSSNISIYLQDKPHLVLGSRLFSESETDEISNTSNENLTQEERYVIRHMERMDPQGEENDDVVHHRPNGTSVSELEIPTSSSGTKPSLVDKGKATPSSLYYSTAGIASPSSDFQIDVGEKMVSGFGKKTTIEFTSSGAFFDHRAVSKTKPVSLEESQIIAQLTREMKLYSENPPSSETTTTKMEYLSESSNRPILNHSDPDPESNCQLLIENQKLRVEIREMAKKVSKVSELEREMAKIHEAYESLLKVSDKRESLEKNARSKLQAVIVSLSESLKEVSEKHETLMNQIMNGSSDPKNQNIPGLDAILRSEINRKDILINQLMNQNKMLIGAKERQDAETNAQRETLEEQRTHIKILDTALSNAQATVLRLEEDSRVKENNSARIKQMTRSLQQLQAASEKREATERKLRGKLEQEISELRSGIAYTSDGSQDELTRLKIKLSLEEEKVIRLESEKSRWEQRFVEETALRTSDGDSTYEKKLNMELEKDVIESSRLEPPVRQHSQRKSNTPNSFVQSINTLSSSSETQSSLDYLYQNQKSLYSPYSHNKQIYSTSLSPHESEYFSETHTRARLHSETSPSISYERNGSLRDSLDKGMFSTPGGSGGGGTTLINTSDLYQNHHPQIPPSSSSSSLLHLESNRSFVKSSFASLPIHERYSSTFVNLDDSIGSVSSVSEGPLTLQSAERGGYTQVWNI